MLVEIQTQQTKPPGHNPFSGFVLLPGENAPNRNFFVSDGLLFLEKVGKKLATSERWIRHPLLIPQKRNRMVFLI